MTLNTNISKARAKAMLDDLVDALDSGTAASAGYVKIFDGTQEASPDAATTDNTLAQIMLDTAAAFGAATTGTGADTGYVVASAAGVPKSDTSADATGTAAWFRAYDKDGTAIISGSCGVGTSYDMNIDNTSIAAAQTVKINSWKIRLPYK